MISKVRIRNNKASKRKSIYLDGRRTSHEKVAELCGVTMRVFRSYLEKRDRTQRIKDWIAKFEAGIDPHAKTFWFEDTPMWVEIVAETAEVSKPTALVKIKTWQEDGDIEKLMGPKVPAERRDMVRLTDSEGNKFSCSVVSGLLDISANKVRYNYSQHGCDTLKKLMVRLGEVRDKSNGLSTYETIYGDFNVHEIMKVHPFEHNMTISLIYGRLGRRGGMCPSLWWDRMSSTEFAARLVEDGLDATPNEYYTKVADIPKKQVPLIRTKACYRKNHTERCRNYWALTETFIGKSQEKPEPCRVAVGRICKNYCGEVIDTFKPDNKGESTGRLSDYTGRGERRDKSYLRV